LIANLNGQAAISSGAGKNFLIRAVTTEQENHVSQTIEQIKQTVINGRHKEIEAIVRTAIDENLDPATIIDNGFIAAMDVVGKKFGSGEIYVPEMLVAAATMKKGIEIIKPLLKDDSSQPKGTILMGTVKGDLHDIGKNLVIMMFEGAGFRVVDLGVDLSAEKVVEKVREIKPDALGLSALLTTTMPEMQKVIGMIRDQGLRDSVKVMVGGAPVDAAFAGKIGADGYGKDAADAVQVAKKLIGVP
jgi:5-methyltetrahydrofolate--homocysteine methyltransferase